MLLMCVVLLQVTQLSGGKFAIAIADLPSCNTHFERLWIISTIPSTRVRAITESYATDSKS